MDRLSILRRQAEQPGPEPKEMQAEMVMVLRHTVQAAAEDRAVQGETEQMDSQVTGASEQPIPLADLLFIMLPAEEEEKLIWVQLQVQAAPVLAAMAERRMVLPDQMLLLTEDPEEEEEQIILRRPEETEAPVSLLSGI